MGFDSLIGRVPIALVTYSLRFIGLLSDHIKFVILNGLRVNIRETFPHMYIKVKVVSIEQSQIRISSATLQAIMYLAPSTNLSQER